MTRSSCRWALLSLACACMAMPANAMIVNGPAGSGVTTDWDGVGALIPHTGFSPATATLIDTTHVLTAAHAVYNSQTGGAVAFNAFTFDLAGASYDIANIVFPTGYDGSSNQDIAVITLKTAVTGHTTYHYNTGSITETSEPTTLVGYGAGGDGTNGENPAAFPFGTRRAAVNAIDQNTDQNQNVPGAGTLPRGLLVYDFDNASTGTNGPLGGPAIAPNEGDTTNGDSGGPMFQLDPTTNQYLITGITSDGTDPLEHFGDISWGTRVSDYATFIAANVPEPISLAPILLALPFLRKRRAAVSPPQS